MWAIQWFSTRRTLTRLFLVPAKPELCLDLQPNVLSSCNQLRNFRAAHLENTPTP
jgi:hypothetical protein